MSKEEILTYNDGSCYIGEVLNGKKHGKGVLSTCAFVYSAGMPISSEMAHLSKWNEYHGIWVDDKMEGPGQMLRKCGTGTCQLIYDGMWKDDKPVEKKKLG